MKAIYINLDPYLAAFAAWLKGGKVGPAPTFSPLPLAVTVPLGTDVAIYIPCDSASDQGNPIRDDDDLDLSHVTVNGQAFLVGYIPTFSNIIESAISLPFSSVATSGPMYAAVRFTGASYSANITLMGDSDEESTTIPFTVLVRRETASGPVDLVDFTPPAAAIAAGTDLKGCKFDGNEIVAAKTTGALSAPAGA